MQNFGLMRSDTSTPPTSTGTNHSYVLFLPEDQENLEVQGESVTVNRGVLEVLMNDTGALSDGTNYAESVIEEEAHPDHLELKVAIYVDILYLSSDTRTNCWSRNWTKG